MSQTEYVFQSAEDLSELDRLRAIEAVFDPATRRHIQSTGFTHGWQCLEVGAGAGSVASWIASVSGPSGQTTAIDINTRFLNGLSSGVRVIAGDICTTTLEPESFDLVHTRYVLIHLPNFAVAIEKMMACPRPGGWLVLEEPDFSQAQAISGDEQGVQSVTNVNRAILQMFASKGMDHSLGARLPALLQAAGLRNIRVENDAPISRGAEGVAEMMKMSARQLRTKYVSTGEATEQDVENYCTFAGNRASWAIYYATVGVLGQK
jgi:SAM-dependent methyltransferase